MIDYEYLLENSDSYKDLLDVIKFFLRIKIKDSLGLESTENISTYEHLILLHNNHIARLESMTDEEYIQETEKRWSENIAEELLDYTRNNAIYKQSIHILESLCLPTSYADVVSEFISNLETLIKTNKQKRKHLVKKSKRKLQSSRILAIDHYKQQVVYYESLIENIKANESKLKEIDDKLNKAFEALEENCDG